MSANYTITLTGTPLAIDAEWTIEQFHQAMLQSISGTISSSNIILGRVGGSIPTSDIGVWLDGLIWKAWYPSRTVSNAVTVNADKTITSATINFTPSDIGKVITGTNVAGGTYIAFVTNTTSAEMSNAATGSNAGTGTLTFTGNSYQSIVPAVGSNGLYVSLVSTLTGDRTVQFQDKDGTVALLDDVYTPRATISPTQETPATTTKIDWSLSNTFALSLTKSIKLENLNSVSGQEISIMAYNAPAAVFTIDWSGSNVKWDGGTAPTMSTSDKADVYVLRNVGGQVFGDVLPAYA